MAVAIDNSTSIKLMNLQIAHCPSAGVSVMTSDNVTVENSIVFGNTWWSTKGESAIQVVDAIGGGKIVVNNNIVHGNRNYMPNYQQSPPPAGVNQTSTYGSSAQFDINDGNGISVARSTNYTGSFEITRNIVYDNGVNGISVHRLTNNRTKVLVEKNLLFGNGKTSKVNEYRQSAGGILLSSGEKNLNQTATLKNNTVYITEFPGTTYNC